MKNKQKLKLFWKITNHINKKFCKNKLEISDIRLFEKSNISEIYKKAKGDGYYFHEIKTIIIKKDKALFIQILILLHELVHAVQRQLKGFKGKCRHNQTGKKLMRKFLKETDKIIKIS